MAEFFDLTPENQKVAFVDAVSIRQAEKLIVGCEGCSSDDAQIPFDNVLDRVTDNNPAITDHILEVPAKCPRCKGPFKEKALGEVHP